MPLLVPIMPSFFGGGDPELKHKTYTENIDT